MSPLPEDITTTNMVEGLSLQGATDRVPLCVGRVVARTIIPEPDQALGDTHKSHVSWEGTTVSEPPVCTCSTSVFPGPVSFCHSHW